MRRLAAALAVPVALLLHASPAAAASAALTSPSNGHTLTASVPLQVTVSRDCLLEGQPSSVAVRLAYPGSRDASLSPSGPCNGGREVWGNVSFDPRAPSAFGLGGPLPNGEYRLQPFLDGAAQGAITVLLSVAPSTVSDLAAAADDGMVTLMWKRAPEPDMSAHRVQRRASGGSWQQVASLGGGASSYLEDVAPGSYDYRVVTVRPDGKGGELTATSAAVGVKVAPRPAPSPTSGSGGSTGSGGGSGGGSTGGGGGTVESGGSAAGGGSGSDGGDGGATPEGGDPSTAPGGEPASEGATAGPAASSPVTGLSGRRVARPPGVRQGITLDGPGVQLPDPQVAPQRGGGEEDAFYFGEDQPFSEELDYSAIDPLTGERVGERGGVVRRMFPGALQEFIVHELNTRVMLLPIAAGLVFVALGLHMFRWMRES